MGIIELTGVVIGLIVAAFLGGNVWNFRQQKKNEKLRELKDYKDATERMGKVAPPVGGTDAADRLRNRLGKH